jgi:hypothetical protein
MVRLSYLIPSNVPRSNLPRAGGDEVHDADTHPGRRAAQGPRGKVVELCRVFLFDSLGVISSVPLRLGLERPLRLAFRLSSTSWFRISLSFFFSLFPHLQSQSSFGAHHCSNPRARDASFRSPQSHCQVHIDSCSCVTSTLSSCPGDHHRWRNGTAKARTPAGQEAGDCCWYTWFADGIVVIAHVQGRLWELISTGHEHFRSLRSLKFLVIDEADRMVFH